jgi:hypothetical protein
MQFPGADNNVNQCTTSVLEFLPHRARLYSDFRSGDGGGGSENGRIDNFDRSPTEWRDRHL